MNKGDFSSANGKTKTLSYYLVGPQDNIKKIE